MPISPGDIVGPYRIIESLGQGGMATVFKAYHTALDRHVAIKVLHPSFKEDPSFNARFTREARIVAKLDHPNIVPIYDFEEQDGTPYLVMRYIEGKTLKAVLREGMSPIPRTLAIIRPVTDALAYAHVQGILHRDIKPSNIMRANDGHIYLADFGLARIAQAGDSTISQDMLIGTPQYISPEQARGEPATERSDLYSLGVVLFEMFTGRVPFSADTPYAIIHDHIYTALPLPTVINPDLPEEIERFLLKVLAKDPGTRFASATELMAALDQAAGVQAAMVPTISPPPTPLTQFTPPPTAPEPIEPVSPSLSKSSVKSVAAFQPAAIGAPTKPARAFPWKILVALGAIVLVLILCGGLMFVLGERAALSRMFNPPPDTPNALKPKPGPNSPDAVPVAQARARVNANPQDPEAHVQLGDAFAAQKNNDAAFSEYDTAIKLNPKFLHAYAQAGELATNIGDFERADKYYAQGRALAPDDMELLLGQGDLFVKMKKYDDARTTYERALKLDPNSASALWRVANLQRLQGQPAEALRNFTRALAIDPNLPEAHFGMGMLLMERGNKDEARRQFQIVINNSNSPFDLKDQAQKQLSALGEK